MLGVFVGACRRFSILLGGGVGVVLGGDW